jgi:predicted nucleotidyltransferase component of viral defense system
MVGGDMPGDATRRPLLRADLNRIATRQGVPTEVIEKDYLLSYLLAGLTDVPELHGLKFKGGTALRKVYYGDYRFSEDLDFSAVDGASVSELAVALAEAGKAAEARLQRRGRS